MACTHLIVVVTYALCYFVVFSSLRRTMKIFVTSITEVFFCKVVYFSIEQAKEQVFLYNLYNNKTKIITKQCTIVLINKYIFLNLVYITLTINS